MKELYAVQVQCFLCSMRWHCFWLTPSFDFREDWRVGYRGYYYANSYEPVEEVVRILKGILYTL